MKFEYSLSINDYRNYLKHHVANSKTFHNAFRIRLVFSILILVAFYWIIYRNTQELLYLIFGGVFLILFVIFSKKIAKYIAVERDTNKMNPQQFAGQYIAELREKEIYIEIIGESKRRQLVIEWISIKNKEENDAYYFLHTGTSMLILPKYNIPSEGQKFIDDKLVFHI